MAARGRIDGERVEGLAAAAGGLGLVLVYALRGGSYDLLRWSEAGVAIWWLLGLGVAAGVLPRARLARSTALAVAAFAVLAGWTLLALTWTESADRTVTEFTRVLHHLGVFLFAASLLSARSWSWALYGVMVGAAIVAALAVGARLTAASFATDAGARSFGGNRLSYPLNYWNAVAAWSTVTAGMALAWSAHAQQWALRAAALGAVPVAVLAGYLTYSRQAAGGMAVALLAVWAFSRHRGTVLLHALAAVAASAVVVAVARSQPQIVDDTGSGGGGTVAATLLAAVAICAAAAAATHLLGADTRLRLPRRTARIALAAGAAVLVVVGAVALPSAASEAWDEFRGAPAATAPAPADPAARLTTLEGNRYELWASSLRSYESDPLHGTGPGTYGFWWSRDGATPERVRDAHSLFLEAMAETGWPGLLLTLVVVLALLLVGVRARVRAASAPEVGAAVAALAATITWIAHAGLDWLWESTANTAVVLFAVGAASLAGAPALTRPRPPVAVRIGGAVACLLVALSFLPGLVGLARIRDSQQAAAAGRPGDALAAAEEAVDSQPWAAPAYLQRALVFEASGNFRAARIDLRRAIEREPTNWAPWVVLARVEAQAGRPRQAIAAYRRSRELTR